MIGGIEQLLQRLAEAPAWVIVATLGLASALENLVPPIPADVVVLFGGALAGQGGVNLWLVFLAVWVGNVGTALLVYAIGLRYGAAFFSGRWGRMILHPQQLTQLDGFYRRYGFRVIFVSRFLPMFRAVVPVFAGVSRLGFWRTAVPIAAASGLWYGLLVYVGAAAGRNWREVLTILTEAGRWLWAAAVLLGAIVGWWWWRSR